MVELWREYQYRKLFHLTHAQFLAEPVEMVEWSLAFTSLENRLERAEMNKAEHGG